MKRNQKDQVVSDLRSKILALELAPGAPLDELNLSAHYGLSRTPLREVLQRLAGEGYITLESNRGASVSSMDLITMRNFFQTAPMIYAAIARLATEHASTAQITDLKKTQGLFRKAVMRNVSSEMASQNHRFHELLGEMSASTYLMPSLGRLLIDHTRMSHRFYGNQNQTTHKRIKEACDQHDGMIDALETRDADVIVDLTWQHWELSRSEMDKYVRPDPLPVDMPTDTSTDMKNDMTIGGAEKLEGAL